MGYGWSHEGGLVKKDFPDVAGQGQVAQRGH